VLTRGEAAVPVAYGLLAAAALPLLAGPGRAGLALAIAVAAAFAYSLLDLPGALFTLPIGVALFAAVDAGRRWQASLGIAAAVAGVLAIGTLAGRGHVVDLANAGWFGGWLVASFVLGEFARGRRAYVGEVEQQAGVGLHLLNRDPEQARVALENIHEASRERPGGAARRRPPPWR
jgi:hypothetical protein